MKVPLEGMEKMINEDNFIQGLKSKDLKSLDYLVENYSDLALKISYSILNNRQLSEECTNDILLKIWDNIDSFKGNSKNFAKWFVVVTKRHAIDVLRREKRHRYNLELKEDLAYTLDDNTFEQVNKKLEGEALKSSLEMLDKNSKEIIVRRYLKMRAREISSSLEINKSAVSNRLSRVKKKLKHIFIGGIL